MLKDKYHRFSEADCLYLKPCACQSPLFCFGSFKKKDKYISSAKTLKGKEWFEKLLWMLACETFSVLTTQLWIQADYKNTNLLRTTFKLKGDECLTFRTIWTVWKMWYKMTPGVHPPFTWVILSAFPYWILTYPHHSLFHLTHTCCNNLFLVDAD